MASSASSPSPNVAIAPRPDLAVLYRRHRQTLIAYIRRHQHAVDAEDLVQDVFEHLTMRAGALSIKHPRAYLYATARSRTIDTVRQCSAMARALASLDPADDALAHTPEEILDAQGNLSDVFCAIIRLPQIQCLTFLMARFDDLTVREISEKLEIPRSTVQDHITGASRICRNAVDS